MSKCLVALTTFCAAMAGVLAAPYDLVDRASSSSTFSLFAYGTAQDTEIGGFPIFYFSGYAYIANPAKVNYTESYVQFEVGSDDSTEWIANPLTASNATWTESLFYVPVGSGPTGFYKEGVSNVSANDIITTGFRFYGTTAMLNIDGTLDTQWYAVSTEIDGLWSVGWNATGGGIVDAELISLRKVTGSNVDYPKA